MAYPELLRFQLLAGFLDWRLPFGTLDKGDSDPVFSEWDQFWAPASAGAF